MKKYLYLIIIAAGTLLFNSCNKENQILKLVPLSDYFPLQVGKYIIYDLDSTVFVNFGVKDTVIRYQVKDIVDAKITDNLGRPAYRITRLIRKDATKPWTGNNTFMAIPTDNSIEFIENNLRFQKLTLPIQEGRSWKGNTFIDTYSLYSDFKYLADWDYTYESVGERETIGPFEFEDRLIVNQRDEFLGQDPKLPTTQYAEKNFGLEKYAKGVGLVYKEFVHWEYQGAQPGRSAYFTGYGIKLTIADHN